MKRPMLACVSVVLLLGLAGSAAAETVKVGMITSASGPFGTWGAQMMAGVRIYQEQHGKSVDGNEIEILLRDDGGPNPGRAKQLAEELVLREKVRFLTGFTFSPNALAVADLITQAKIPTILANAATGFIPRKSPYFVRVSFSLAQQAGPLGEWAAKHGYKTVDAVVADYVSGTDSFDAFNKSYTAGGGKILNLIKVPVDIIDFSPYYQRVLQDKPQAMFGFGTGGANSLLMMRTWSERLKPADIGYLGALGVQQGDLTRIGEPALGIISTTNYPEHADNPINKALWESWKKDFPDQPDFFPDIATCATYDAMELIYRAVAKFGPKVSGDEAIGLYKGMQVDSPRGSFTIDPKERDIIQDIVIQKVEKRDGIIQNVPFDVIRQVKDAWKEEHPE
ncbi:MAG: Extracellular ligand-binding receptor [Rhodospirillales bacterium]|jgi:branched-chain amino acid transport system substrate-binding protein|nr:Extracellular ligand-binding receptor [Rhodospirillales bacterium]